MDLDHRTIALTCRLIRLRTFSEGYSNRGLQYRMHISSQYSIIYYPYFQQADPNPELVRLIQAYLYVLSPTELLILDAIDWHLFPSLVVNRV